MSREVQLCQSCELDYFYVIARYHGVAFPGHEKFALQFFREHGVLPLSVECPNCKKDQHNFVDPDDPTVHTQNIERLWRDVKEWMKRPGNRSVYFRQYLSRYLFIRKYPKDQVLHYFFKTASLLYPPQGERQRPQRPHEQEEEEEEHVEEEQL